MIIVDTDPDKDEHIQPVERSDENDHALPDAPDHNEAKEATVFREMGVLPDVVFDNISSSANDVEHHDFPLIEPADEPHIISLIDGGLS